MFFFYAIFFFISVLQNLIRNLKLNEGVYACQFFHIACLHVCDTALKTVQDRKILDFFLF